MVDAQLAQGADTADAQQEFLLEAVLPVAAIQVVGHLAVLGDVGLIVGVQQVQVRTAHLHFPHAGGDGTAREGHARGDPVAIGVHHRHGRDLQEVLGVVVGDLVALAGDDLGEVAEPVEEAHGDEVHVHVGGLLQVVAGQDAETARIDLQGGIQTVFHAEVGNGRVGALGLLGHVGVEFGQDGVHLLDEGVIVGELMEPLDAHRVQQGQRIVAGGMPDLGIDGVEELFGTLVPAPPQVLRKPLEGR